MTVQTSRFRLGLFVVGGLALFLIGIVALSAGRIFTETYPVYCYFRESVQGLEPGSAVKFRGVQIGRVEAIDLLPQSRIASLEEPSHAQSVIEVRCDLQVQKITDPGTGASREQIAAAIEREVAAGLRVRVTWKDITGTKYLDLDYVDPKKAPPPPLPFAPRGTYIPSSVESNLIDIQRDIATVTSELARVDYRGIAADITGAVVALRKRLDELDTAGLVPHVNAAADAVRDLARNEDLKRAFARADAVLAKAESAMTRIDELVSRPAFDRGLEDVAASAATLRRITTQLEETIPRLTGSAEDTLAAAKKTIEEARLPETTTVVRGTLTEVGGAARQVAAIREESRRTLADLDEAARGLTRLVRYLEENPDALLRGKAGRQ
jgi:phospholipid/cholesterol/gamma-HCH transport system substrate-binding protein